MISLADELKKLSIEEGGVIPKEYRRKTKGELIQEMQTILNKVRGDSNKKNYYSMKERGIVKSMEEFRERPEYYAKLEMPFVASRVYGCGLKTEEDIYWFLSYCKHSRNFSACWWSATKVTYVK